MVLNLRCVFQGPEKPAIAYLPGSRDRGERDLVVGLDFEDVAVEAGDANGGSFRDGLAGGGLPDFAEDLNSADGHGVFQPEGLHGGA